MSLKQREEGLRLERGPHNCRPMTQAGLGNAVSSGTQTPRSRSRTCVGSIFVVSGPATPRRGGVVGEAEAEKTRAAAMAK